MSFKTRFAAAYDNQIQRWVNAVAVGTIDGPSAWDGYLAAAAVDTGVKSLNSGANETVTYAAKPKFYN
jgi:myo-inositol 2-dehydrogenase/D-chiro-inositol 1-dehydrogenase